MNKIFAIALFVFSASAVHATDVDSIRTRFDAYYAASAADPSAPRMRRALDELESLTRQITGPIVYVTMTDANTMRIDATDPNANATGTFQLTIPGAWRTTSVAYSRTTRSITLAIPRKGGETTTVILTRATNRRRAVR